MDKLPLDLDGAEYITPALMDLVNQYPRLDGQEITFSDLKSEKGITLIPAQSAVILSSKEDVTGRISQNCAYPFYVYYRVSDLSEHKKINLKEWLDDLGRWLELQPIKYNDETHQLAEYPKLTGKREIKTIKRQSPAYLQTVANSLVETWVISMQIQYTNEFMKGAI